MPEENVPPRSPATVGECRQAIKASQWELLRLVADLADRRQRASRLRRDLQKERKAAGQLWRQCRDRLDQIELMRDLIRSSPDGRSIDLGEPVETVPAGLVLLEQIGQLLQQADLESEKGLRLFFRQLAELQELAKDFFDYAGVKLVYELGELLAQVREAPQTQLRDLARSVAQLRQDAASWFQQTPRG